ncbi:MAG TPA: ATP synthase F1 subunit delta [Syntrophorhabdus sp.]|nr:ATP synthase F1 subunit delta [Syntrophorhabdus sp.]MDI9559080.1 ATP synthase F1 subunit delta [Pseudomonadota bacterium]OPX94140.1 MAG: ATP synthase subunit delta, sodium ion specific [Syntrophorhabdus sp. PtaB.Bin027]OQB76090.1 MAG: ATP synthase subunit delta, sodium ion specific [Deltaproteobacteria bacterium ADurb.Bin135]MBP8744534.1 ATP synthase F1 subunit delta [Syntrophorhabdus sp.]
MIRQSIAKRYAKGLFAVGEKDGQYKGYLVELENILDLFEKEQRLKKALMLPLLEVQKRKELLSDTMRISGTSLPLANMLTILLEKNRMSYLPIIKDVYSDLVDDKEDRARGIVWTAFPLDPAQLKRIEEALQTRLQKKEVILSTIEDKSLIGGVKVAVKGTIIDGSVKKQLEILKENILKE